MASQNDGDLKNLEPKKDEGLISKLNTLTNNI